MSTGLLEERAGEIVPRSDDAPFFEIVDGQIVELPAMSLYANKVAKRLFFKIGAYLEVHDIGEADYEVLYDLHLPRRRIRRPDVSFVSYERWPKDRPYPYTGSSQDVIPDLATEVISPGDEVDELSTKINEFFRAGVRLVWVVHCLLKQVHVYQSITAVRVLTVVEELDGGDVLPGFRVAVASLFPLMIAPEPPPSDE